jgi:cell division transport system ATP-binding protein
MIKLLDVQKTYKQSAYSALSGITLEVDPGEFVFLIGSSGSGKSSLLRLILREERPDSGEIYVLGNDLGSLSTSQVSQYRRRLGVVFQDFRLLPDRDVFANVAFALEVIGKSRAFISTAVPDVLRLVGLEEKSGARPSALSGGQQQRVAIARALVNRPDILLADEPTGNLDTDNSAEIMNLLERINQSGTTVLMATHDQAIVDRMQRRVIALSEGKIVEDRMNVGYEVDGGSVR